MRRIQRQRTKGWRIPEGAIYVGRPSLWGNPYREGMVLTDGTRMTRDGAMLAFRWHVMRTARRNPDWLAPLRGHDLACWCPLDVECHADILIELCEAAASSPGA